MDILTSAVAVASSEDTGDSPMQDSIVLIAEIFVVSVSAMGFSMVA
jgi:hypothetical protein